MTAMRTPYPFLLRAPLAVLAAVSMLTGCRMGVVPETSSLDFGDIYLVGSYSGSTPLENEAGFVQTITAVAFDDGSAFSLTEELPFTMEQRTPYAIGFELNPVPGSFGALSDVARLTVNPKVGQAYEVRVNLSANFFDGDLDDDGVVDVLYGGEDCDDNDADVFGGLLPHEEV